MHRCADSWSTFRVLTNAKLCETTVLILNFPDFLDFRLMSFWNIHLNSYNGRMMQQIDSCVIYSGCIYFTWGQDTWQKLSSVCARKNKFRLLSYRSQRILSCGVQTEYSWSTKRQELALTQTLYKKKSNKKCFPLALGQGPLMLEFQTKSFVDTILTRH